MKNITTDENNTIVKANDVLSVEGIKNCPV